MDNLPEEIVISILYFSDVREIGILSLVSKKFAKTFHNEFLWRKLSHGRYNQNTFRKMFILSVFCQNNEIGANTANDFFKEKRIFSSSTVKKVSKHLNFVREVIFPVHDFPKELCTFTLLEKLDLSFSRISNIPREIKNLKRLKHATFFHNWLTDISALSLLENLEFLDISNNKITKITEKMPTLKKLFINYNKINSIPDGFDNLEILIGDFCSFHTIPTNLPSAKELILRFNDIRYISEKVVFLKKLKKLFVCGETRFSPSKEVRAFLRMNDVWVDF